MNIAIIGAGPAGIISARNAIKAGHSVVLFEKNAHIGGIWNPRSGGAYRNACMQNSHYAFHYTDFPPGNIDEFPGVAQVFAYLSAVTGEDALRASTRLNTEVVALRKDSGHWVIRSTSAGNDREEIFDRVIIATGELWQPRRPTLPGAEHFSGTLITSKDYQEPEVFKGKNILIIGGGVSGADIASDLVPFARSVSLSVKKMGLYLPRQFRTGPNDMMHSYLGRCLLSRLSYADFISYLDTTMPDYMQTYRASGFWLLGYQFSPRLADAGEAVFWRVDKSANYGALDELARGCADLSKAEDQWDEMMRTAGSLKLGTIHASELIHSLLKSSRPSGLAQAIMEVGRVNKTMYLLNYIDDEDYRRRILTQLNRGEGRHAVARAICYGQRGEIRKRYREGQEDQLGALGLVTNAVVLWNTLYMQEALSWMRSNGEETGVEDITRLSPLMHGHINMLGHYTFTLPEDILKGELRTLNYNINNELPS
ncbi:Tn3 family transposase [Salmonella enterica]|nr:Tn3 family transposase [Salmonella enterica]